MLFVWYKTVPGYCIRISLLSLPGCGESQQKVTPYKSQDSNSAVDLISL